MQPGRGNASTRLAAAAAGAVIGSFTGFAAGILGEYWPGPPYVFYMVLVSIPPAIVFIMLLSEVARDILVPPRLNGYFPSFGGGFVIMYGVAFVFSYWIRV